MQSRYSFLLIVFGSMSSGELGLLA